MFFYTLIIPALVLGLIMICHLVRAAVHDKMIFRFCQVRRKIIAALRDDAIKLPESEYAHLRRLLEMQNTTIHLYDGYKASVYDLRSCIFYLRKFKSLAEEVFNVAPITDSKVLALKIDMTVAYRAAFFTYIPFTRSQLCLTFGVRLLQLVKKMLRLPVSMLLDGLLFIRELNRIILDLRNQYSAIGGSPT